MITRALDSEFWGLSASLLGTYEAVSYLSHKRLPTISSFCARTKRRKATLALWTIGLGLHIWKHQNEVFDA